MNDPFLVGDLQRLGNLDTHLQRLLQWKWPLGQPLLQRLPLDVLHDDEVLAVVGLSDLLDVADERVIAGSAADWASRRNRFRAIVSR